MVQAQTQAIDTQTTDVDNIDDTDYADEIPNAQTIAAMRECDEILAHPENYKWYDSFADLMADVLGEQSDDD